MNGTLKSPVANLAAIAATAAFLVSGGVWLGNLQTRLDEHTELLAHLDADQRLDEIEVDLRAINSRIDDADNLLHALSEAEERRHKAIMDGLRGLEWAPYLKEE